MKYDTLASEILAGVGGRDNVKARCTAPPACVSSCVTTLRQRGSAEENPGVIMVVESGGQFGGGGQPRGGGVRRG